MYFSDAPGNADDPILALVPAERRATLIAQAQGNGLYHWDVRMQGELETVFFDY
jgi:protocatechuate 3,4-dioxygenase alpha subunit